MPESLRLKEASGTGQSEGGSDCAGSEEREGSRHGKTNKELCPSHRFITQECRLLHRMQVANIHLNRLHAGTPLAHSAPKSYAAAILIHFWGDVPLN